MHPCPVGGPVSETTMHRSLDIHTSIYINVLRTQATAGVCRIRCVQQEKTASRHHNMSYISWHLALVLQIADRPHWCRYNRRAGIQRAVWSNSGAPIRGWSGNRPQGGFVIGASGRFMSEQSHLPSLSLLPLRNKHSPGREKHRYELSHG